MTALVFPIVAARTADLLLFIDWTSGYSNGGSIYVRAAVVLVIAVFAFCCFIVRKRMTNGSDENSEAITSGYLERSSFFAGTCLFLAGFATAAASVGVFYDMVSGRDLSDIMKNGGELFRAGDGGLYYILLVASAALGIFVAFWFMLVGIWYFRGEGYFAGGSFISVLVAVWYYTRVIKDFIRNPVNPNNTTALALLFSVLILAVFYTKLSKAVSVDILSSEEPLLAGAGAAAFLWVLGIGVPTAVILVNTRDYIGLLALVADAFAAVAALSVVFVRLPVRRTVMVSFVE